MNAKRILAAALSLTLALGLTACSGGTSAGETPEEVLAKAQQAMEEVKSMGYDMDMTMTMEADGLDEALEILTTYQVDTTMDPLAVKANMEIDMGELGGSTQMQIYLVEQDGSYQIATGTVGEDGQTTWQTGVTDSLTGMEQLDGKAAMDVYLSSAKSFTQGTTETINGTEATRYDGVIAGADLEEVLETSGTLEQLDGLGLGDMSSMLTDLADLPISIWIAKDTYYPVQYEMDMAAMMQTMLEKSMGSDVADLGMTISQLTTKMTLRDFNNIPEIQIPSEAMAG